MKKFILLLTTLLAYQTNYAQWYGVPMPVLPPAPNGQSFNVMTNNIVNNPDTIIGMAVANLGSGNLLRGYFYSVNRGQSYNVLLTRPEGVVFVPPIQLRNGLLFDLIYIPNNNFSAWDTSITAPLFKNLKVDPWWYKRHGNYLEDSVGYYVNNSSSLDTLFKSTDLGITKTVVLDSITRKINQLNKIFILDKNHIWARRNYESSFPSALGSLQLLYRTRDGGTTWQRLKTNLDTIHLPAFDVKDMYFISPDTGFMSVTRGFQSQTTGTSELYRTTNGGSLWTKISEMPVDIGIGAPFNRLFFVNSKIGFSYGVAGGGVSKTTDGGYTWLPQPSLPTSGYREMSLVGNNVIWVRSSGGGLYYTTTMGDATVGVEEQVLRQPLSVSLYPNPAQQGKFTMQWDATTYEDAQVAIYDVMGKQVYKHVYEQLHAGENSISIELDVAPGVYYVRMQQGAAYASKSVLIGR